MIFDPTDDLTNSHVRPISREVLAGMLRGVGSSLKALTGVAAAVFGLLGIGLVALATWRHDPVTITVAVVGLLLIVVFVAWYRSEQGRLDERSQREAYMNRATRRCGYYEMPNGHGILPGRWPIGGNGGNGGNGGTVYGDGNANGGNGGAGAAPGGGGGGGGAAGIVIPGPPPFSG